MADLLDFKSTNYKKIRIAFFADPGTNYHEFMLQFRDALMRLPGYYSGVYYVDADEVFAEMSQSFLPSIPLADAIQKHHEMYSVLNPEFKLDQVRDSINKQYTQMQKIIGSIENSKRALKQQAAISSVDSQTKRDASLTPLDVIIVFCGTDGQFADKLKSDPFNVRHVYCITEEEGKRREHWATESNLPFPSARLSSGRVIDLSEKDADTGEEKKLGDHIYKTIANIL